MSSFPTSFETRDLSFSFLPCFDETKKEPFVVGTCNDLVLCCPTRSDAHDYYVCNPYTKHWVALPPPPRIHGPEVRAGFVCDRPYYTIANHRGDQLDGDYRFRVVRIPQFDDRTRSEFTVEIYSSETGAWKECIISLPKAFTFRSYHWGPAGVSLNGMVYWIEHGGLLIGIDPFNDINVNINNSTNTSIVDDNQVCRFIEFPKPEYYIESVCLGVFRGRLRMCHFEVNEEEDPDERETDILCIWELKQVSKTSLMKWSLIKKVALNRMDGDDPEWEIYVTERRCRVLAFDANEKDVLYIEMDGDIVGCNYRSRTWFKRERVRLSERDYDGVVLFHPWTFACPLSLPCWPTPLPLRT